MCNDSTRSYTYDIGEETLQEKKFLSLGITEEQGFDRTRGVLPPNPTLAQQIGFNDFVRGID